MMGRRPYESRCKQYKSKRDIKTKVKLTCCRYRSVETRWRGNEGAKPAGRILGQGKMPNGQVATPVRM